MFDHNEFDGALRSLGMMNLPGSEHKYFYPKGDSFRDVILVQVYPFVISVCVNIIDVGGYYYPNNLKELVDIVTLARILHV